MTPRPKRKKYSDEQLLNAVAEVKNKSLSTRRTAEKYGVPQATLVDRVT